MLAPERHKDWTRPLDFHLGFYHRLGDGPAWRVLATCPERWRELVHHPTVGAAVQHLLLDRAETEANQQRMRAPATLLLTDDTDESQAPTEPGPALDDDLLRACLPALCLPELADLPKPSISARHRLHHIAERVRDYPRLLDLAAEELREAADTCIRRGRLLGPPRNKKYGDGRQVDLAQDVALLSINPDHLAKACVLLTHLEHPKVVSVPPSRRWSRVNDGIDRELDTPARLLENDYQHHRAEAVVALANNPHTPRTAVTDVLQALHPLELTWITLQDAAPQWLRTDTTTTRSPSDSSSTPSQPDTQRPHLRHDAPSPPGQCDLLAGFRSGWNGPRRTQTGSIRRAHRLGLPRIRRPAVRLCAS